MANWDEIRVNRKDFQFLAKIRIKEAKILLDRSCFEGAYYISGYTIECALKACIAKETKRHDFPDKDFVKLSYTHKLETLLNLSGLQLKWDKEVKNNPGLKTDYSIFNKNWAVVKDWSEKSRYAKNIEEKVAKDFYTAVSARKNGVLAWIKKLW